MTGSQVEDGRETRLIGWKRIANHLRCGERTARRWEREEGLPVYRQAHEKRSTVYALPSELDDWVKARSDVPGELAPQAPGRLGSAPAIAIFCLALVLAGAAIYAFVGRNNHDSIPVKTDNPVAADLYERGRALWLQRGEAPNARAIKLLTEAVEQDENFAEGWAALSLAWLTYPTYTESVTTDRAVDEALLAADRAVRLDPTLAEPRSVMATIAQRRGDWLMSQRVFDDAISADPDNTTLMLWFAGHYRELGMMREAIAMTDAALVLDPNSPPILTEAAMNDFQVGKIESSRKALDYLWFDLGLETPIVWVGRWFHMLNANEHDEAINWLSVSPFARFSDVMTVYVRREQASRPDEAAAFVEDLHRAIAEGFPSWLAFHMLDQGGLTDAALDVLDAEAQDGSFDNAVVLFFPRDGQAKFSTRYRDAVQRLGFVKYWRVRGAPDLCDEQPDMPLCQMLAEPGE